MKEIERLEEEHSDLASKKRRKLSVNSLLDNVRSSKYDIASSNQYGTKISGTVVHDAVTGSRESIPDSVEGNTLGIKVVSNDQPSGSPRANSDNDSNDKLITLRGSVVLEKDKGGQAPSFSNSTDNVSVQGIKSDVEFTTDASRKSLLHKSSSNQGLDSVGRTVGSHESKGNPEYLV